MNRIIDFHVHTFPDHVADRALAKLQANSHTALFAPGTAAGLQASMRRAGIDRCVILPAATAAGQSAHINDRAVRTHESAAETGLDSFAAIHPEDENWKQELDRAAAAGLRGVKIHPPYQGVDIDDPRYLRILNRAGELDLTVVTHAGLDVGLPGAEHALPSKIRRAVLAAGPVRLVCAHMGGWKCWKEVCELLADTGVWLDTAFSLGDMIPSGDDYPWTAESLRRLSDEDFVKMIRLFGADRVLFGTDSPWSDQKEDVDHFCRLPLSEHEKRAVLSENAERLLGLQTQ